VHHNVLVMNEPLGPAEADPIMTFVWPYVDNPDASPLAIPGVGAW
jgi:hypothetical protein